MWGAVASSKGVYDLAWGEPQANLYALEKWTFVSREAWARYAGFELAYGLACLTLAWLIYRYAARLPLVVTRPRRKQEFELFG